MRPLTFSYINWWLMKYILSFDWPCNQANRRPTPKLTFLFTFFSSFSFLLQQKMSDITAPVLPDHVKKPNEEEYKKTLEQVNANIEKIQKQFASIQHHIEEKFLICLLLFRMLLEKRLQNYLVRVITTVARKLKLN